MSSLSKKKSEKRPRVIFFLVFILAAGSAVSAARAQKSQAEDAAAGRTISSEEFMNSSAAQAFQSGKYEEALSAIDQLLQKYPKDPLLVRYKAITLDQMGRSKEAIALFEDLLLDYPSHVPTHYFLGQAYARSGNREKARKEWQWVMSQGEGTPYQTWAQTSLERFVKRPAAPTAIKRWNVVADYGYEYDSNVILRPNDGTIRAARGQDGGRQVLDLGTRYRAYSRRDMAVDLLYTVRQSIHDHSFDEFNFHSEEFGINLRKRLQMRGQDFVAGLRYDFLLGILGDRFFSARNRWNFSLESRFTPRTRTVFFDRISEAEFTPDGPNPSQTSRDGLYNDVGVTQYLYSPDFRRYVFARQEFNNVAAQGKNFDNYGTTSRIGFFTPLVRRLDLETSTGLRLGFYPHFSSVTTQDLSRRRDVEWDIYTALTYRLTSNVGLRGFYRYINSANRNNVFDYDRQIGGAQVVFDWLG